MEYSVDRIRLNFPSLQSPTVFFDNPGGTQVTQSVIDAMRDYFLTANANTHGAFETSRRSDEIIHLARVGFADFLNANSPDEIAFGPNMTSLTFQVSRALGRMLEPGDEIIVTRLDHDANISPWLALEERGAVIKWVDIHTDDCTLDMADFERQLSTRTRIVAVGLASNAVGSVNPARTIADLAHMAGAIAFFDAVHFAPHFSIDVRALDCDLLACSAYKFYGPHIGVLYTKPELAEQIRAYKVRPAEEKPPYKFETGTQNHEGIAGALAAVNYLASLGGEPTEQPGKEPLFANGRRLQLERAMSAIHEYEKTLFEKLVHGLKQIAGIQIYGITDPKRFDERAPTIAFNLSGQAPRAVASRLAEKCINVWDGNYYALALMERLGLEEHGGAVRVGLAHYNTADEVDTLLDALSSIANG